MGLALGTMYIPSLAVLSHYFQRRRALAMGIAASGSSIGTVIHPIMLNHLFHGPSGFHVGVRASAGLNLGLMTTGVLLMRTRLPPKKTGAKFLPQLVAFLQDPPYVFAISGYLSIFQVIASVNLLILHRAFFVLCAMLFPFFFIQLDAITHGVDPNLAFYTVGN
jgi:MCP family monocarboxylic acid transporter-like MFS transporter 10